MTATHVLTMNGHIHTELEDTFGPQDQEIRRTIGLLEGRDRFSLLLWALPPGVSFAEVDLGTWPQEYILCAGSQAGMTVGTREVTDGVATHYVIGRPTREGASQPERLIIWAGEETKVRANEVLDPSEAADLFVFYYRNGTCPDTCSRRVLAL